MKENREICIKPFVLIVATSARFRSSLILADQFTAGIVGRKEEAAVEDTSINV